MIRTLRAWLFDRLGIEIINLETGQIMYRSYKLPPLL